MDHKKMVVVPATTKEVIEKITCDFCGKDIVEEMYDVNEVTIKFRSGSSYPSGGSGDEEHVDMCRDCYLSKLKPWILAQGVKIHSEEWYW